MRPWCCLSTTLGLRGGLLDSYRALGELHALVLQQHGIAAQVLTAQDVAAAKQGRHANAPAWACFGGLSHGEVVNAEGRKLVGLAQRRRRNGVLLVAGTLVSRVPWTLLCTALGHPQDEALLAGCTVSMEESLGQPCASAAVAAQLDRSCVARYKPPERLPPSLRFSPRRRRSSDRHRAGPLAW